MAEYQYVHDEDVVYNLRDINKDVVSSWNEVITGYQGSFKISQGDIFNDALEVDAIVAPGNSFGIMGSKRDEELVKRFGKDMPERLQKVIRDEYDGELLLGQAAIIPAFGPGSRDQGKDLSSSNNGEPIKYIIYTPTMRAVSNTSDSPNSYLAFRAVILAIRKHNKNNDVENMIKHVLVPGLGTGAGGMPAVRCAWQMLQAYETYVMGEYPSRLRPESLTEIYQDHIKLCQYGDDHDYDDSNDHDDNDD